MAEKHDTPTSSVDIAQAPSKDPKDPSLTGTSPKAIIKNVDMSEEMQQDSVDIASAALEKYNIEKDIAAQIKKEFDRRHGPTWHVVVGKNFGSYVTHGMCICLISQSGSSYAPLLRSVFPYPILRYKYLF